jgi:hypothetical protein
MIDRTAILNLQAEINRGRSVIVTMDTGVWIELEEVVGVQADSHAIMKSEGRTYLVPLDKITLIESSDDEIANTPLED